MAPYSSIQIPGSATIILKPEELKAKLAVSCIGIVWRGKCTEKWTNSAGSNYTTGKQGNNWNG